LRLGTRLRTQRPRSHPRAIRAGAIPLGKSTPGCGAEDHNAHTNSELEFGVGVRANFTIQADILVLRGRPFHSHFSFIEKDSQPLRDPNTEAVNKTILKLAPLQNPRHTSGVCRLWPRSVHGHRIFCALKNSERKKYCSNDVIPICEAYYSQIIGVLATTHA
jgi:hypothetical protein